MRILYFVRLYSGLEKGLARGLWEPKGVPTITRMIEALDRGSHDLKVIFTCKDYGSSWSLKHDISIQAVGLSGIVDILTGDKFFPVFLGRLRSRLSIVRQTYKLWRMMQKFKPDVVYIDRGNLWSAAFISRISTTPVIWRVMGVLKPMHDTMDNHDWRSVLSRWAFKSPFAAVICTLDGSGGGQWMAQALKSGVPRHLLLNGVNVSTSEETMRQHVTLPKDKSVILFVGRIEENKGAEEFLSAFAKASQNMPEQIYGVIVGDGSMLEALKLKAKNDGVYNNLLFTGSLTQQEVLKWQKLADIYVSLNRMGNLSNANLEAIASGACMIIPRLINDSASSAELILPDKAVLRFGTVGETTKLAESMIYLHKNPDIRKTMSAEALHFAQDILKNWPERVQLEIDIMENLKKKHTMREVSWFQ